MRGRRSLRVALCAALAAAAEEGCREETVDPPRACPSMPGGFSDCTPSSGVTVGSTSWTFRDRFPNNGAALGDCDGDGGADALSFSWVGTARLYHQEGAFSFRDVTRESGLPTDLWAMAAAFGDLDHDGLDDLVTVLRPEDFESLFALALLEPAPPGRSPPQPSPIRVFRGLSRCRFSEVTAPWGFGAPLPDAPLLLDGVRLWDVNLDGRLDVAAWNNAGASHRPVMFLSRADGVWEEQAGALFGAAPTSTWSAAFSDLDADGLSDVLWLHDGAEGRSAQFFHREAPAWPVTYREVVIAPSLFGPKSGDRSLMGASVGDVDGDGSLDVFITDVGAQHLLVQRAGFGFESAAARAGVESATLPDGGRTVGFGSSMADWNNDGAVDLLFVASIDQGNRSPPFARLFENRGDGTFAARDDLLRQPASRVQEALSAADFDRDGRVDYWLGGSGEGPRIVRNEVAGGASFALRLRGRTSNTAGLGARVVALVGDRSLVREMSPGGNSLGGDEPRIVLGLGARDHADGVEVRWPSGFVQRLGRVEAGAELTVTEPALVTVETPSVPMGGEARVVVRPAQPDGSALGSGHAVRVTALPGGVEAAVTDRGDGSYLARWTPTAAGDAVAVVSVDGATWTARPNLRVR